MLEPPVLVLLRQAKGRQALLRQLQQGMSGCTWEPADWEWRPTWTPSMRHSTAASSNGSYSCFSDTNSLDFSSSSSGSSGRREDASPVHAGETQARIASGGSQPHPITAPSSSLLDATARADGMQQQYRQLLGSLTKQLADLEGPKRGLALLHDNPLLLWCKQGLTEAVQVKGPGACVLVIANGGGGVLAMLAAAAGAGRVVVVEKGRWGYRAAKQLIEGNRQQQPGLAQRIELAPVPLSRCCYSKSGGTSCASASGAVAGCNDSMMTVPLQQNPQHTDMHDIRAKVQAVMAGNEEKTRLGPGTPDVGACYCLPQQADIVVTDLLDYR